ncbi:hypothetical protein [Streptomyces sp. NPDC006879]|uniref:hypothetical protein n=1 Tax=Streptomyces sp. NPDC006879 TaxID=3364767 RepID=UPI0036B7CAED
MPTPPAQRTRRPAATWRTTAWHRPLVLFTAAMVLLLFACALGLLIDDRRLVGAPIWHKPLKFSASFALYGATLAWMHSFLTRPRARRVSWWAGTVIAAAGAIEMLIIVGQVVRGKRSHFNNETPLDSALFGVMGATVAVLWLAALLIAVLLFRRPAHRGDDRPLDPALLWSLRLGSAIALVGLAIGFLMAQPTEEQLTAQVVTTVGAHSVGVPDGGPHLPVTGWSATGGDLRIGHFVGMHALQVLPLLALALLRIRPTGAPAVRLRLVLIASGGYAGLVALVTWQALRGQALTEPDAHTLIAAGLLTAASAVAVALALRSGRALAPARTGEAPVPVR